MSIRILDPSDGGAWDQWLRTIPYTTVRQTSHYATALAAYGYRSEILQLEEAGSPTAGTLLGIKKAGLGAGTVVRTSGGISLADAYDPEALTRTLEAILDRCSDLGAATIEIIVRTPVCVAGTMHPAAHRLEEVLQSFKLDQKEPMETYCIDTARSDDLLLESFGRNKKRDIRKATREGVVAEPSREIDDFRGFEQAHKDLSDRKGLDALPANFGTEVLLPMAQSGLGELLVARFQDIPRNYVFVGHVGTPVYTWGALAPEARARGCPPTGEILQYAAMRHFRSLGAAQYDLGGTPGETPDPAHPNYTVWRFKHDFGGVHVRFVGLWGRVLRPVRAALLESARKVKARLPR